jgi:hypothetical protein
LAATRKFVKDLAARLSEIDRAGATTSSVIALLVSVRHVIEDTKIEDNYRLAALFCTWAVHIQIDRNKANFDILDSINDIIFRKTSTEPIMVAISKTMRLDDLRSQIVGICTDYCVEPAPIQDDLIWKNICHHLLDILCEKPVSLPIRHKDFKSLVTKYANVGAIVSSFKLVNESSSSVSTGDPYYWCLSVVNLSNVYAVPNLISGAVSF